MVGSGNSLRKVAHDTHYMLDYRNSIQIMNATIFTLTMKVLAKYTAPNIFINMMSVYN